MRSRRSVERRLPTAKGPRVPVILLGSLLGLLVAAGCRPPKRPQPSRLEPLPSDLAEMLLPPARSDAPSTFEAAARLHVELLAGHDPLRVLQEALLAWTRTREPAWLLIASQAELVAGRPGNCLERLRETVSPEGAAWEVLEARCLEGAGEWVAAAELYRRLSALPAAERRLQGILPAAAALLETRTAEALAQGDLEAAERELARLRSLRRDHLGTLTLDLRIAQAREDRKRELDVLRAWPTTAELPRSLVLRRADLELELGNPSIGLEMYRQLLQRYPSDPGLAAALPWAELRWRLANAPVEVRSLLSKSRWTRADLARFLFWAFAQVRTGSVRAGRIATDILDHPAREELIRVINLNLISIDPTLRTFEPDRGARRVDLLRALQSLLELQGSRRCAGSREGLATDPCDLAFDCGWLTSREECAPHRPLDGPAASSILERAVRDLETP